jgi:epoxyqueuosine reductase
VNYPQLKTSLRQKALSIGFNFCGFAESGFAETEYNRYCEQISCHYHAGMAFLERNPLRRFQPDLVHPAIKTVIVTAAAYPCFNTPARKSSCQISGYARVNDYHSVIRKMLDNLIDFLKEHHPGGIYLPYTDSGPVSEKTWARKAGIGWIGKNSLLLTPKGSFFFLGVILTDLPFPPDDEFDRDLCGNCRLCMDACPTGALVAPHVADARKCLSYHTIESKDPIPQEIAEKMNGWVYGCDICQNVCPYNQKAERISSVFSQTPTDENPVDLNTLTEDSFNVYFANSPVLRLGWERFRRNLNACRENKPSL